jgi:hypothetical protein
MARYCGVDRHYADVECPYAEFERYLVLSCNEYAHYWKENAADGGERRGVKHAAEESKRRPVGLGTTIAGPETAMSKSFCAVATTGCAD